MKLTERQKRIDAISSELSKLQKEFTNLTDLEHAECIHPYIIGWKCKSSGFVMTEGKAGCPQCGLTEKIHSGHRAEIPLVFRDRPIHWIDKNAWRTLFDNTAHEVRIAWIKQLGLNTPPDSL